MAPQSTDTRRMDYGKKQEPEESPHPESFRLLPFLAKKPFAVACSVEKKYKEGRARHGLRGFASWQAVSVIVCSNSWALLGTLPLKNKLSRQHS